MISLASGIKKLRFAAWLAVFIGPVALVTAIVEYRHEAALIHSGARAEGKINSFRSITAARGTKVYFFNVTWRNELDGKLYQKDFSTAGAKWPDGPPRQTITVTYDPNHPGDSWVGIRSRPDLERIVIASVITVLGIVALIAMHFIARHILRRLELTEERHPN